PGVVADRSARQAETVPQPADEVVEQGRAGHGMLLLLGDRSVCIEVVADGERHASAQAAGGVAEGDDSQPRQTHRDDWARGKVVVEVEPMPARQEVGDADDDTLAHDEVYRVGSGTP